LSQNDKGLAWLNGVVVAMMMMMMFERKIDTNQNL